MNDNPYLTADTPHFWGVTVADFVKSRAEKIEELHGCTGEYLNTLNDKNLRADFERHAQQYTRAMWKWVGADKSKPKKEGYEVPEHVLGWVNGDNVEPLLGLEQRFSYLIFRREIVEWWDIRRRVEQISDELEFEAERLKQFVPILSWARKLGDDELFKHLVSENRQTRANLRIYDCDYLLMEHWMIMSLWDGTLGTSVITLKKRLKFEVDESTLSRVISKLKLRPTD